MWLKVVVLLGVSAFIAYLDGKLTVFILTLVIGAVMFGIIYIYLKTGYTKEKQRKR